MNLHNTNIAETLQSGSSAHPVEHQLSREKPTLRFEFEGYAHRATDWSLDGFCVEWHRLGGLRTGDTFIIRGLEYGDLEATPVFLRAEVTRIGQGHLAARFLDLNARGRRLFNDFMARWAVFELAAEIS